MVDRPAWYPEGYPYPPVRAARSRLPFPIGSMLSLYEAARLVSGRHPYPISPDGITTLGPCWGLIAGGSTGADRRRHHIPAEMCRLAQPGTISDGGIDWLNVKVDTGDVVHLCEEQGWRCGLLREPLTTSVPLVIPTPQACLSRDREIIKFMKEGGFKSCDKAIKAVQPAIRRERGRKLWRKAGLSRPRGRPSI
jgi:hypothetical protein